MLKWTCLYFEFFQHFLRLELGVSEEEDIQNESGIFTVRSYLTLQRYREIVDGPEVSWP